ncbi:MAG: ribosome biogenesis GTPase Der [Pseudomonadota bacterium]
MKVAVVGRPNVGKSSVFNCLAGKNKAVTDDLPGVTRDRLFAEVELYGKTFELIDTGGYEYSVQETRSGRVHDEHIQKHIVEQIHIAIEESDFVLFVVDGKEGLHPADKDIAALLRKAKKDFILVVNKIDNDKIDYSEFHSLGIKSMFPFSAAHALGYSDLTDAIVERVKVSEKSEFKGVRLAIAGRPNTGKSTLLNAILGETRVVTSEVPGTTRDVIDTPFSNKFGDFVLMDTAGIRRHSKTESKVEVYSIMRSKRAVEFSDVALLVIDGTEGFTHQDKRVTQIIAEAGVGCVIVINKRDLMEREFTEQEIHWAIPYLSYAPIVYISALYENDFSKVFKKVKQVYNERNKEISTGELNKFFKDIVTYKTAPLCGGKEVKLKFMVQATKESGGVPRFIVLGRRAKLTHESYRKYIISRLRERFGFDGNPIELIFKEG